MIQTAQDLKIGDDGDLQYSSSGDFIIAESDNQHIEDILASEPGYWKQFPEVGASVRLLLKGKFNMQKVESVCKEQLEHDGYQVSRPKINIDRGGVATINPKATRIKF